MDSYLESLVKKDEFVPEKEEIEIEIGNEEAAELISEPESATQLEPIVDQEIGENGDPSVVASAVEAAEVAEEPDVKNHEEGQTYFVRNIRIYKTPDINQIARNYTGNIIYKGQLEDVAIVEYVRPGFGAVLGYTLDLN